jgi:predicted permease
LKDGVSAGTALANLVGIARQLQKEYPENLGQGAAVSPLSEVIVGFIRPVLLVLLAGSALLLLIAGVNVASLLLVRTESRRREMAVRSALGAGRARLNSQFATEGLILAIAGSALGTLAAFWLLKLLAGLISEDMLARVPYLQGLHLNLHVLAFAAVIAVLTALLFSVTPALHFASQSGGALRDGSRGSSGNAWRRLGSKLVVLELATAIVLLVGAGLLGKSLYLMLHDDVGFLTDHLATLGLAAPDASYAKAAQQLELTRRVSERISSLPGVKSVGISSDLPVQGWGDTTWFKIVGRPSLDHNDTPERDITASYFPTLGAKLLRGRNFREDEDGTKPRVAIINRALQKVHFPNEDPVGKRISSWDEKNPKIWEIVGVVEDIKEGPLGTPNQPVLYFAFNQEAGRFFNVAVRTAQAEESLLPAMSAAIHQIDPDIVTFGGTTMRLQMDSSTYLQRTAAWLVGGFAVVALLLGVVGLYGVVAYSVSQRTREIGVRMALGAERSAVYELVLKEAGWLTVAGIAVGLLCAVGAAQFLGSLLFGVKAWDGITLLGVAVVLLRCWQASSRHGAPHA